jgi:hypothetical protein
MINYVSNFYVLSSKLRFLVTWEYAAKLIIFEVYEVRTIMQWAVLVRSKKAMSLASDDNRLVVPLSVTADGLLRAHVLLEGHSKCGERRAGELKYFRAACLSHT